MLPLHDIKVVDFSFHLPGPLASLILAEAGARVVKVERPGSGDELRQYPPMLGNESLGFAMLNRGKGSVALDLKAPDAVARLAPLLAEADVVIEQFRPGVMDRLGLGHAAVRAINPDVIYCSITGYGQTGPDRLRAGHDLNYLAETGVLALAGDAAGTPVVPPVTIADIAGGTYPAVMNILLALRRRDRGGGGAWLDISMTGNLFALAYWAVAETATTGTAPRPAAAMLSGGSPRYAVYRASDGRHIAAAPLEDRFWHRFCDIIDLPAALRGPAADPEATRAAVAARIATRPAAEWGAAFGDDCCCSIVATLDEAMANPHFRSGGYFSRQVLTPQGMAGVALDVPVDATLRSGADVAAAPAVGVDTDQLLGR